MKNERLLTDMELVELFCMDCDKSLDCRANAEACDGFDFAQVSNKAQDAKSIAAHDKWWVHEIMGMKELCTTTKGNCGYKHCGNYDENFLTSYCPLWQSLKQSKESVKHE